MQDTVIPNSCLTFHHNSTFVSSIDHKRVSKRERAKKPCDAMLIQDNTLLERFDISHIPPILNSCTCMIPVECLSYLDSGSCKTMFV